MGRGTWKNSEFVPLGGGAKYEFRGRSRREKRHETCWCAHWNKQNFLHPSSLLPCVVRETDYRIKIIFEGYHLMSYIAPLTLDYPRVSFENFFITNSTWAPSLNLKLNHNANLKLNLNFNLKQYMNHNLSLNFNLNLKTNWMQINDPYWMPTPHFKRKYIDEPWILKWFWGFSSEDEEEKKLRKRKKIICDRIRVELRAPRNTYFESMWSFHLNQCLVF